MKQIEQVRRENLAALVGAEPSQAEFARKIRKDKNQVNQWLGRAGSRNMSAATAREIEAVCGKTKGWMDQEHSEQATGLLSTSQDVGLDLTRMQASIAFLERQFDTWGYAFVASERTGLIAEVYRRLGSASPPAPVELSQWLVTELHGESDVARQGTEGAGRIDRERNQRRAG